MSLYNMVHGVNQLAPIVFLLLDKPPTYFGRIRDAWIEKNEHGQVRLAIYTRNGGNNRIHYGEDNSPAGVDCDCTGCVITHRLPADPLYVSDKDDDYDNTYATVYFKVPDNFAEILKKAGAPDDFKLEDVAQDAPNMQERWEAAVEAIRSGPISISTHVLPVQAPHEEENNEQLQVQPGDASEGQDYGLRGDSRRTH